MNFKKAKITILPDGNINFEALEGFSGSSCHEVTKDILNVIGGTTIAEGQTDEAFKPDNDDFISHTINEG